MKVYLAGGMHSNWRKRVTEQFGKCMEFLDPTTHGLIDEVAYTRWDLNAIYECDVVFAYMDSANPSGFGLCVEVGYASGIGRPVVYVCEDETERQRYFGMVRACAIRAKSFDDGLNKLRLMDEFLEE